MTYEGVRDWFGRECKQLVNIRANKWQFEGVDVPGLEGFEIDVGQIKGESGNVQKVSDLVLALDSIQFLDCQRRRKWHQLLKEEKDPEVKLEMTRRIFDSEDKTLEKITEIVRLMKGAKSIAEDTREFSDVDVRLEELLTK
jgi:hypothetical protein